MFEKKSNVKETKNPEFWENPAYKMYRQKHGEHFCDRLAEWASKRMKNANGESAHTWSVAQVESVFNSIGLVKPETATWGDVTYAANMAYADYFGSSLKTEADVIRQAYADVTDPDGYPGKVFNRWLSDVMGMQIQVPWQDFM